MNKLIIAASLVALSLGSCNCNNKCTKKEGAQKTENQTQVTSPVEDKKATMSVEGNYVTSDYAKRNEGYDWVAVIIRKGKNGGLEASVRSRVDIKKPTCTFDAQLTKKNDNHYYTTVDGKEIVFEFVNKELKIYTADEADKGLLNFYCSGGGSLAGTYDKIQDALDANQIDKTPFKENSNDEE